MYRAGRSIFRAIRTATSPSGRVPQHPLSRSFAHSTKKMNLDLDELQLSGGVTTGEKDTPSTKETGDKKTISLTTHNQYHSPRIEREKLNPSPLIQFQQWFAEALHPLSDDIPVVKEPEAMSISTSTPEGIPSSRFVLLKEADETGFVFYTNYTSRKSREIASNPYASIALYWKEHSRSVRAVGRVEKVDRKTSEAYFATRPRGSKLGAWASEQSKEIEEGEVQDRVKMMEERFPEGTEVPCPDFWGGWRIVPFEVEFWSGQPSRLHDRFRYTRDRDMKGDWTVKRLSP